MKSAWESANEDEGTTESERYLTRLAKKAFLSLWSYPNLFTDEGRASGKGDGKELCDLLVVFGDDVLLFSDKQCDFIFHQNIEVSWSRWYRRAIEKSARQLIGAEKFIREHPGRLFLDRGCQTRLPLELPDPSRARYYLIAVTRGSTRAAAAFFGGGGSGSLMLDTSIKGSAQHGSPFRVGWPVKGRFIHVLDELTLDVVLEELDTLPDIIQYLKEKERYLSKPGVVFSVPGEEELVARFMLTVKAGKHGFPALPAGFDFVGMPESDWSFYIRSPQRKSKKDADAISYLWDSLIEYQSSFIRSGKAGSLLEKEMTPTDHERVVRALADETRFSRRQLATFFRYALSICIPGRKFAQIGVSASSPNRYYVFLTAPKPSTETYEQYREMRAASLSVYCNAVKLRYHQAIEVVGIASEPMNESFSSQDFMYVEFGPDPIDRESSVLIREAMRELDIFQPGALRKVTRYRDVEFPTSFDLSQANNPAVPTSNSLNRRMRRAMKRRSRSKR